LLDRVTVSIVLPESYRSLDSKSTRLNGYTRESTTARSCSRARRQRCAPLST
jgi:hypothetical protein